MSERLRVLDAMLVAQEPFTIRDLAEASAVNVATVRTVVNRERRFLTEVGRLGTNQRGGKTIKYILNQSLKPGLKQSILELGSRQERQNKTYLEEENELDIPITLLVAGDILERQLDQVADENTKQGLRRAAIGHLGTAKSILNTEDDGSESIRRLKQRVLHLEGIALDRPPAGQSAQAGVQLTSEAIALFERARREACLRSGRVVGDDMPVEALIYAADYFKTNFLPLEKLSLSITPAELVKWIALGCKVRMPLDAIHFLGREPASYQAGVVDLAGSGEEKTFLVSGMAFSDACVSMDSSAWLIQGLLTALLVPEMRAC